MKFVILLVWFLDGTYVPDVVKNKNVCEHLRKMWNEDATSGKFNIKSAQCIEVVEKD